MKKRNLKPYKLGVYQLGHYFVDLWVDPKSESAAFDFIGDKKNMKVTIGLGSDRLWSAIALAVHESAECLCDDMRLRFRNSSSFSSGSDMYTFVMDHSQFTEVCARVGGFLHEIMPDLTKAHKKLHG